MDQPGPPPLPFHSHPSASVRRNSYAYPPAQPQSWQPSTSQPSSAPPTMAHHSYACGAPQPPYSHLEQGGQQYSEVLYPEMPPPSQSYYPPPNPQPQSYTFQNPPSTQFYPSSSSTTPSVLAPPPPTIPQLGSLVTDSHGQSYTIVSMDVKTGQVTLRKVPPGYRPPATALVPETGEKGRGKGRKKGTGGAEGAKSAPTVGGSKTGKTQPSRSGKTLKPPSTNQSSSAPYSRPTPLHQTDPSDMSFSIPTIDPRYLLSGGQLPLVGYLPAPQLQPHHQPHQAQTQTQMQTQTQTQPRHPLLLQYYETLRSELPHLPPQELLKITTRGMVSLLQAKSQEMNMMADRNTGADSGGDGGGGGGVGNGYGGRRGEQYRPEAFLAGITGFGGKMADEMISQWVGEGEMEADFVRRKRSGSELMKAWIPPSGKGGFAGVTMDGEVGLQLDLGLPPIPPSLLAQHPLPNSNLHTQQSTAQPSEQPAAPANYYQDDLGPTPYLSALLGDAAKSGWGGNGAGVGRKSEARGRLSKIKTTQPPNLLPALPILSASASDPSPLRTPNARRTSSAGSNVVAGFLHGVGPYVTRPKEMGWEQRERGGSPLRSILECEPGAGRSVEEDEEDELMEEVAIKLEDGVTGPASAAWAGTVREETYVKLEFDV